MRPGDRVRQGKRVGVVKALRPGNSVDVQFDDVAFLIRQNAADLVVVRENPGTRGGLTPLERDRLPTSSFALPGRRFPINDANHGRIALQYILAGRVSEGDVNTVVRAVLQRWGQNREVMDFYNKHKANLTRANVEKIHGRRMAANPAGEVYDPAKEQFRAVVQGVYESLVRKELKKGYNAPFETADGKRLDAKLTAEKRRLLLSSAYAIATRQGQKHGWLEFGTQTPTEKGIQRSAERLLDPEQRKHAEENRQDYERTLASVRKSGHFRVVAEEVNGQKRYVVEPRPSPKLVQIPAYRLSAAAAQEDADRAESAFQKAPAELKAKSNPREYDSQGRPKEVIIGERIEVGRETLGSLADALGVSVARLVSQARVLRPKIDKDTKKQFWEELPRGRLARVAVGQYLSVLPMEQLTGATPVDPKLTGARVSVPPAAAGSAVSHLPTGSSAAYFVKRTSVTDLEAGGTRREGYFPSPSLVQEIEVERSKGETAVKAATQRSARAQETEARWAASAAKEAATESVVKHIVAYALRNMQRGFVLSIDEGIQGRRVFAYYAPTTKEVDPAALESFVRASASGRPIKTPDDDQENAQAQVWTDADEAHQTYADAAESDAATYEKVAAGLSPAARAEADASAASRGRVASTVLQLGGAASTGSRMGVGAARTAAMALDRRPASSAVAVSPERVKDLERARRAELEDDYKIRNGVDTVPLEAQRNIQARAADEVELEAGKFGLTSEEVLNLAKSFEATYAKNKQLFLPQFVDPVRGLRAAEKEAKVAAITPPPARAVEEEDPKVFWDIESREVASNVYEPHYVLYVARFGAYLAPESRSVGRTIVRAETGFVRTRNKVGSGGNLEVKEDTNLTSLLTRWGAARNRGDFIEMVKIESRLSAMRKKEGRRRAQSMLATEELTRDRAQTLPILQRVAAFTLPAVESVGESKERDEFLEAGSIGAAATQKTGWVEDLAFTRSMRIQSKSGQRGTSDPRAKYIKFVTTNPLLAFYTIQLWNTPELFTGASITLPTPILGAEGEEFEVVNLPPVHDPRNRGNSPMFSYYMGVAFEVLMQGALAAALIRQDFKEASRIYLDLYGTRTAVEAAKDKGFRGALRDLVGRVRPLPYKPVSEEVGRRAKAQIEGLMRLKEESSSLELPISELSAAIKEQQALLKTVEIGAWPGSTPLGVILTHMATRGSSDEAQAVVYAAWANIQDPKAWEQAISGEAPTKLLTNRRPQR